MSNLTSQGLPSVPPAGKYTGYTLATDKGIATGLTKGYITTKRTLIPKPSSRKAGRQSPRVKLIRQVIRKVAGYAPYEKRIVEILKSGGSNPTKRAWRFAKRRLGTHVRAKAKVAEMNAVIESGDLQK